MIVSVDHGNKSVKTPNFLFTSGVIVSEDKVMEILSSKPRNKTELVVNAVLHYISCPEAADEFSKETMKRQIREVIQEMLADGSLSGLAAPPATH